MSMGDQTQMGTESDELQEALAWCGERIAQDLREMAATASG